MNTDKPADLVDPDLPSDVHPVFAACYKGLSLLKKRGFKPDFIVDVGASTGCWSYHARLVFPSPRFILVEPLASLYRPGTVGAWLPDSFPEFEVLPMAVADRPGKLRLNVAKDLCSSSLYGLDPPQFACAIEVPVTTLDAIAAQQRLSGRGLLKLDIQFAEHLALMGAARLMRQVDAVVIEISLIRYYPDCKIFLEILQIMDRLGFQYFDDVGEYRRPDGVLSHKDGLFVRKGSFV
jgi:FkbM family methyltransferase